MHIAVVSITREKYRSGGTGYAEPTDGPGIYADIIPQHLEPRGVGPEQSAHVTFAEYMARGRWGLHVKAKVGERRVSHPLAVRTKVG